LLPVAIAKSFIDVVRNISKGRGQALTLTAGRGFFPFGAVRGDSLAFTVKIIEAKQVASLGHPGDLIPVDLKFVNVGSFPYYSAPAMVEEGSLAIGTITGLRFPMNPPELLAEYGFDTKVTNGNNAFIIDQTATMDCWKVTLPLVLNQGNIAHLQYYLLNTVRANEVLITIPSNSYLFGVENAVASLSSHWIDGSLEMTHETFNRWKVDLNFHSETPEVVI
jgi:hypothetical protein